jgi:predicted transposase YdaD
LNIRYINFEKEIPPEVKMPKVYEADITDLIAPFKEKWKREGLEEGKKQGLKQGLEQGKKQGLKQGLEQGIKQGLEEGKKQGELKTKIETAKKLLKKGIDIEIISEATGLSKKELKKYGII